MAHYRALLASVSIVLVPSLVVGAASLGYWRSVSYSTRPHGALGVAAEVVGLAVVLIGGFLAQAAGVHAATSAYVGASPDWRRSLRVAVTRWRDVGATGLAVAVLSTIGLALFIVPGVVLWCTWFVAMPVVVMEGGRARDALRRSAFLMAGRRVAVLVAYVLVELLVLACSLPIGAIVGAAFAHSALAQVVAEQVAVYAVEILLTPLQVALVLVVYLDERYRRDGTAPADVARAAGIVPVHPPAPGAPRDLSRGSGWGPGGRGDPPLPGSGRPGSVGTAPAGEPAPSGGATLGGRDERTGWPAASAKPSPDAPLRPPAGATWPGISPKPPPPSGRVARSVPPSDPAAPPGDAGARDEKGPGGRGTDERAEGAAPDGGDEARRPPDRES